MDNSMSSKNPSDAATRLRFPPLTRLDKIGLVLFFGLLIGVGAMAEKRSAFMQRRMTDAGVYFRAAWAVRAGEDLYSVEDDNEWHYNYPPLFAILFTPLADAPAGVTRDWMLPYPLSVAILIGLNLLCCALAAHWLARGIEETSDDPLVRDTPRGCRAWWHRRVLPVLFCLLPVAHTVMRGQVNLIVLLLLAGMLRALVRARPGQAGWWLAGAISIKIIPAFLLVYPGWRRDWKFLGGTALGLVVGLALIPGIVLGPERTVFCYRQLVNGVLMPGMIHEGDPTRAHELTDTNGTDSQSFIVVAHNLLFPDKFKRPAHAAPELQWGALSVAGLLTLLTLLAAQRYRRKGGAMPAAATYVAMGALILVMQFASPVSHMHYYAFAVPLLTGLLELRRPEGWAWYGWLALGLLFATAFTLPHIQAIDYLREFGLPLLLGLVMWVFAVVTLAVGPKVERPVQREAARIAA
jgi:hypothetical protein